MKALLATALVLLPALASAQDALPSLRVDLDGDGKPDLVRLSPLNAKHDRLEIALTKTGARLRYDNLARHWRNPQEGCSEIGHHELKAGPAAGTFEWTDQHGDIDACAHEDSRTLRLRLEGNDLRVVAAVSYSNSWSMGDDSPIDTTTYDFVAKTIHVDMTDHHSSIGEAHVEEPMRANCATTLREVEKTGALPVCATLQAQFMAAEKYPEQPPTAPVCPNLAGAYLCRFTQYDHPASSRMVVVHRELDGANVYDLDSEPAALVTDGKARELPPARDGGMKVVHTATCHRETLSLKTEEYMPNFGEGQPPFEATPFSTKETSWTQLDLLGNHFAFAAKTTYKDDIKPELRVMDCTRVPPAK